MKHNKYLVVLHAEVPLSIQVELSLAKNDPHVPLSLEILLDQSLQLCDF